MTENFANDIFFARKLIKKKYAKCTCGQKQDDFEGLMMKK